MPLSQQEAERLASVCLGQDATSVQKEEIASLWGGMGRIYRVSSTNGNGDHDDFIVKYINHSSSSCRLPMSDKRKVIESYENEAKFFQFHSEKLRKNASGEIRIAMPQSLHVESSNDTAGSKTTIICMSVLQPKPPAFISSKDRLAAIVQWLASFHAVTWQRPFDVLGCFWHYDTRPNVWRSLSNQGLEGRLKRAAKPMDEWLKNECSLQSWIHGDCKNENVLWDDQSQQVAFCDFQYVGQGCPCKDLVYFLTDSVDNDEDQHNNLVEVYFQALTSKLSTPPPTRLEFDVAMELAYCDYLRFCCAWRGQHKVQKEKLTPRVQVILDKIDGGTDLGTEQAYREAIQKFAKAPT